MGPASAGRRLHSRFEHPDRVCMSYWAHMRFSLGIAWDLACGAAAATVHAVVPSLFIQSSTDLAARLRRKLDAAGCRHAA